jgi:hypothetical protein
VPVATTRSKVPRSAWLSRFARRASPGSGTGPGHRVHRAFIANWPRPDKSAARVRGKTYAMPHWLCGYFIFTRNHSVADAKDGDSLVAALAAADAALTKISGNFKSSWDSPCLYLDCWEETYAPKDPSTAVSTNLDSEVIRELRQFAKQGESNGRNPCLDGTYKDNKNAAIKFANRQTVATFGFSGTLFDILSSAPNDDSVTIHSLNLGKAEHPLLFMDGFVLRKGLTELVYRNLGRARKALRLPIDRGRFGGVGHSAAYFTGAANLDP